MRCPEVIEQIRNSRGDKMEKRLPKTGNVRTGMNKRATILVVDDENGVRQSFNMVLRDEYDVLSRC